ncbi:retrovirus-related pol polyprotein from transposon TNT 1-94 [Tanacetum coccineum]
MAAEVPKTLEYRGGQLNVAPVLEVENFTNWKKRLPKKWLAFCPSLKSTNHVKESKLASLFGKLKYKENPIDSIYGTNKEKTLVSATLLSTAFFSTSIVQDFQDSPNDEGDARSSQEYMNDLEEEYQARALLAKSKRFFKKATQRFSGAKATNQTECHKCGKKGHFARDCFSKTSVPSYQSPFQTKLLKSSEHKPELKHTKEFEAKHNKVKAKLALLSSSASASNSSLGKNKGLIAKTYEWDEEEVLSDENEGIEVKARMALTEEERVYVGKESASNGEWVKISIQKVHTLLEMEDNNDRKSFLDYLCIDLNYVEEQRNNLLSKHRNLVQELNTCKEQLLVDNLTMQHVNTKILKENQNLRNKLKELTSVTETWLNSSLKNNSNVSITSSNKTRLSEAEDSTLPNHDTADESSVCSTPLPPLEKLAGAKPVFGPKTIKSILKSKSTFKDEALKGVIINEPSLAPAKGNISTLVSKTKSASAGKLKNVKMEDDPPLAIVNQHHTGQGKSSSRSRPSRPAIPFPSCIHCGYNDHQYDDYVYYPICELCGSYDHDTHSHNVIISLRRGIKPRNPQHVTKNCETCGSNVHTTTDHNDLEWFRKRQALQAKKTEIFKTSKTGSSSAPRSKTLTKRYQANTKESHLITVKRIFRNLKGTLNHGLWYPKCLGFDLKGYSDSDYVRCNMDRKSTSGACQLLGGETGVLEC